MESLDKLKERINSSPYLKESDLSVILLHLVSQVEREFENKRNIITEHFGRADTSVEIVELSAGNNITVIHRDGEAIIFPSIYLGMVYKFYGEQTFGEKIDRIYCNEDQLEFVYENFTYYQDIKDNFDVENTKRK